MNILEDYNFQALNHESIKLLYLILNNDQTEIYHNEEIDILLSKKYYIDVETINENVIILLDKTRNRLIQYNLETNKSYLLAPQGRGEGDLLFTKDMRIFNNKIFVAMQEYRISIFDCEFTPCQYVKTILTKHNNYSVSPNESYISTIGLYPFGRSHHPNPDLDDVPNIHIINFNGHYIKSFGSVYRHKKPIVREQMNSRDQIFSLSNGLIYVIFNYFPYIYKYDLNGHLLNKLEFPEFMIGYYDYDEKNLVGRFRHNDSTSFINSQLIDNKWIIFQVLHRNNMEWNENKGLVGDQWYSYYALNTDDDQLFLLGEDHIERSIYPTNHGLLVNYDNELCFWKKSIN